jgi:hypothetical protein
LELYEEMQTNAAVGTGKTTCYNWTAPGTRQTMGRSKVPPAAFSEKNIHFNFVGW